MKFKSLLLAASCIALIPAWISAATVVQKAAAPSNVCANNEVSVPISNSLTPSCYNLNPTPAPPNASPAVTTSNGVISGPGAGGIDVPNLNYTLVNIASGQPLITNTGRSFEFATTQYIEASNAFGGTPWVANAETYTANTVTSPDGTTDGGTLNATNQYPLIFQTIPIALNTGETCFAWMKATGAATNQQYGSIAILSNLGNGTTKVQVGDTALNTSYPVGTVLVPSVISNFGNAGLSGETEIVYANNWRLLVMNFSQTIAETLHFAVQAGDNLSTNYNGYSVYVYGAQCGPGGQTFYKPNSSTSAVVTRTADSFKVNSPIGTAFADVTYNGTHHEQLPPAAQFDIGAPGTLFVGKYTVNSIVVNTPMTVAPLALAAGYTEVVQYIKPEGFVCGDNVDCNFDLLRGHLVYPNNSFGAPSPSTDLTVNGAGDFVSQGTTGYATPGSAASLSVSPGFVGVGFGNGMYWHEIFNEDIAGIAFTGTTNGTTALTLATPCDGIISTGSKTSLWIGGGQPSGNPYLVSATGCPGTGVLSASVTAAGPVNMDVAADTGRWSAPIWWLAGEHMIYNGYTLFDQWDGQAQFYIGFVEHDACEIFNGNYSSEPLNCGSSAHTHYNNDIQTNFSGQPFSVAIAPTGNATVTPDTDYQGVWVPATPTKSGYFAHYINGQLVHLFTWSRFVKDQFTAATALSTGSSSLTLSAPCSSDTTNTVDVVDLTTSHYAAGKAGQISTCVGNVVTMKANSLIVGSIGDQIELIQDPGSSPQGAAWDPGIGDQDHLFSQYGCINTAKCRIKTILVAQKPGGSAYNWVN